MKMEDVEKYIHVNWYKIGNRLKIVMRLRITFILENGEEHTVIFKHDFSKKISEIDDEEKFINNHVRMMKEEFLKELNNILKSDKINIGVVEFKVSNGKVLKNYLRENKERKYINIVLEK